MPFDKHENKLKHCLVAESNIIRTFKVFGVFSRRCQPVVSYPLLPLNYITSTMQRISVKFSKKTAVRVDEVVVPHDSGAFLGRNNQVGCMTVYTQIIFNRFCIFKVLGGNKKPTNSDTVAAWHEIVNFISLLLIAIAVRTLLLYAHGPMSDIYCEYLLNSSKHECWQNLHHNLLREYNLHTD